MLYTNTQIEGDNPHEQPVQRGEWVAGEHGEQVPQRPRAGGLEGGQTSNQVQNQILTYFWNNSHIFKMTQSRIMWIAEIGHLSLFIDFSCMILHCLR